MRDDIYGGLKNALERGASLDQAVRSFVNAGYSEPEVREAARIFATPAIGVTNTSGNALIQKPNPTARPPQTMPLQKSPITQPVSISSPVVKTDKTIIILVGVLILVVGMFILSLLFRTQIAVVLKKALGL
jgi:hypothetical protein